MFVLVGLILFFFFFTGLKVRNGTEKDEENVKETFSNLGFKIKICNDQTVSQMRDLLTKGIICEMLTEPE